MIKSPGVLLGLFASFVTACPAPRRPSPVPVPAPTHVERDDGSTTCRIVLANGTPVTDTTGRPLRLMPAGSALTITSIARRTDHGLRTFAVTIENDPTERRVALDIAATRSCPRSIRSAVDASRCVWTCAEAFLTRFPPCMEACLRGGDRGSECIDSCEPGDYHSCLRDSCHLTLDDDTTDVRLGALLDPVDPQGRPYPRSGPQIRIHD